MWGEHGFLKKLGVVDIGGSGAIHLVGGSSALIAAAFIGPRTDRYLNGFKPLPMGNPINAILVEINISSTEFLTVTYLHTFTGFINSLVG